MFQQKLLSVKDFGVSLHTNGGALVFNYGYFSFDSKAELLDKAIEYWNPGKTKFWQDAGIDLVFVDGIKKIAEVEAVAKRVQGPKVVSIVDGNETTALTARDLQDMGFSVVFYAVTALFTAVKAVSDALAELQRAGTPQGSAAGMVSYADFSTLVDLDFHKDLDDRYGS